MTTSSRVSDRTLERARLGELDDQELADLMEQLEAEGGLDRLDESIRKDQAFLEKYPAQHVVPLIRNRMERQMRERERETPSQEGARMLTPKAVFSHPVTAAVIAAVVAALVVLAMQQPSEDPTPVAEHTETVETDQQPAAPAGPFPKFAERIDRRLSPLNELVLTPGEQLIISSEGISRIEIDWTKHLLVPRLIDNETKFVFEAGEVGLTGMRIHYNGKQNEDLVYVRILPWHKGKFPDGTSARGRGGLMTQCDELADARGLKGSIAMRVIVAPNGRVASSWVESSDIEDPELIACVEKATQTVERTESDESSTAVMRYSFPITVPSFD